MKIIDSTWQGSDINDAETRDAIRTRLEEIRPSEYLRESYTVDADSRNRKATHAFTASYTPGGGGQVWIEYYGDVTGSEYIEHGTYTEAERAYEERVREMQGTQPEGAFWWEVTDVEGVPTASE